MGDSGLLEGVRALRGNLATNVAIDQSDGATAESAASHPRAKSTSSAGRVDSGVQFGTGDLVVIT